MPPRSRSRGAPRALAAAPALWARDSRGRLVRAVVSGGALCDAGLEFLLPHLLGRLSPREIVRAQLVCRAWRAAARTRETWTGVYLWQEARLSRVRASALLRDGPPNPDAPPPRLAARARHAVCLRAGVRRAAALLFAVQR
jgi:hypothetical protein